MQAISFLAGVVTQGVRSVGSVVATKPAEGESGFNSLLAKAIGNARADEGAEGTNGGMVSTGGTDDDAGAGASRDPSAGQPPMVHPESRRTHERAGNSEAIDPGTPEGTEQSVGSGSNTGSNSDGISIHGGRGAGFDPIAVPMDLSDDAISIHGGKGVEHRPVGIPMAQGQDGIPIHGGMESGIDAIEVPMGVIPDGAENGRGPTSDMDPLDRIRLDRARQPERMPGGLDISGMRSGGSGSGAMAPLAGGLTQSNPIDPPNTQADNDGRFEEAGIEVDGVGVAEGPSHADSDPRTPDRDLDRVHPELRTRLERVVERMATEHGHRVEVVEGYRTPERQTWLYAQGRQRPGQVVTWTRNSMHMEGLAADLNIDGGWDDPTAFAKLQRIAQEEGLATLGMRDPGHVELDVGSASRRADPMASLQGSAFDAHVSSERDAQAARPLTVGPESNGFSRVSRVAEVARVADVAQVAQVATPGSSNGNAAAPAIAPPISGNGSGGSSVSAPAIPVAGPSSAATTRAAPQPFTPPAPDFSDLPVGFRGTGNVGSAGSASTAAMGIARPAAAEPTNASAASSSGDSATATSGASASGVATDDSTDAGTNSDSGDGNAEQAPRQAVARNGESGARVGGTAPGLFRPDFAVGSTEAIRGASTLDRMEQIQAMQDRSAAGSDGWRLTMPDADGMGTRLRMGLRGSMVDAQIDTSDPMAAARMRTRVAELHRALEARGLEGDQFTFRSGGTVEALEAMTGVRTAQQSNADFVRAFMADLTGQSEGRDPRRPQQDSPFGSDGRGRDSNDRNDQENRQ